MYLPVEPQPSCARAWLAAADAVNRRPGREAHNVIINVGDPVAISAEDRQIISAVDTLLRSNGAWPVQTVANTIFPQSLYDRHGSPAFYKVYMEDVFPRMKTNGDWGRYFERIVSFPKSKRGEAINPLDDIVTKMKAKVTGERCFKHVYELTVYDPIRDAGRDMNRQCMSFLSFQLTDDSPRKLLLTAMYRNHYYTQRLLGNLIGLGRLMKFVADEVKVEVGELTIISTHAEVDNPGKKRAQVDALIAHFTGLVEGVGLSAA